MSSNNPITNRAEAFWKAIYNWCDYIKNGEIPEKALVLKYVVVSSHDIKAGTIPSLFAAAKTGEEAKAALENARKELLGDDVEKKAPISQSLKPYIDFCFAQENESFVLKVISLPIVFREDLCTIIKSTQKSKGLAVTNVANIATYFPLILERTSILCRIRRCCQ